MPDFDKQAYVQGVIGSGSESDQPSDFDKNAYVQGVLTNPVPEQSEAFDKQAYVKGIIPSPKPAIPTSGPIADYRKQAGLPEPEWQGSVGHFGEPPEPEPQGRAVTALRAAGEEVVPMAGAAVAGRAGGSLGAGLGALAGAPAGPVGEVAGPIVGRAIGTISGAIIGARETEKLQHYVMKQIMGEDWLKSQEAQDIANQRAHPFWAGLGSMAAQAPIMASGAGVADVLGEGWLPRTIESGIMGGAMGGAAAETAKASEAPGSDQISIPEAVARGIATMGPVGIFKPVKSVLGKLTGGVVRSSAALAVANNIYDFAARGQPLNLEKIVQDTGENIPMFAIAGTVEHLTMAKGPALDKIRQEAEIESAKDQVPPPLPQQPTSPPATTPTETPQSKAAIGGEPFAAAEPSAGRETPPLAGEPGEAAALPPRMVDRPEQSLPPEDKAEYQKLAEDDRHIPTPEELEVTRIAYQSMTPEQQTIYHEAEDNRRSAMQKIIERNTGVEKLPEEKVKIKPSTGLRQDLRTQARVAKAAYQQGVKDYKAKSDATISDLRTSLSDSVPKFEALKATLKASELGSTMGRAAERAHNKMVDRWLSADVAKNKQGLLNASRDLLPPEARGKYTKRIADALTIPANKADVSRMYDRASAVVHDMQDEAHEIMKGNLIGDIADTYREAMKSKSMDVSYRPVIEDLVRGLSLKRVSSRTLDELQKRQKYVDRMAAEGKETDIPKGAMDELSALAKLPIQDMNVESLAALHERIKVAFELGKLKRDLVKARNDHEVEKAMEKMAEAKASKIENAMKLRKPQPTQVEESKTIDGIYNAAAKSRNYAGSLDTALLPTDAALEYMDGGSGTYDGFLVSDFKGEVNLGHQEAVHEHNTGKKLVDATMVKNGISRNSDSMGRIAVMANLEQGAKERMIESGSVSAEEVAKIEKNGLTKGEREVLNAMRSSLNSHFQAMSDVMRQLYNIEVKKVDNYWPLARGRDVVTDRPNPPRPDPTTGEVYDEHQVMDEFLVSHDPKFRTSKVAQGITKTRLPGAKTPIELNAYDTWERAHQQELFIKHMQPVLKKWNAVARSGEFAEKYGEGGQRYVLDLLDTIARRSGNLNTLPAVEKMRLLLSSGGVGGRPSSQVKHASWLPYSMYHAGGAQWFVRGLRALNTVEGKAWIDRYAAEITQRGGADIGSSELPDVGTKPAEKMAAAAKKYGFMVARNIDYQNAGATALGRYMYELNKRGMDWTSFDKVPIVEDAQKMALTRMHRAVASPAAKDMPLLLSRGMAFGGSSSIAKSVFQFGNPRLDQWSNVRIDMLRAAKAGEHGQAAKMATAITMGSAIEAGIAVGAAALTTLLSRGVYHMFFGMNLPEEEKKNKDTLAKTYAKDLAKDIAFKFPFVSQGYTAAESGFKRTGVPLIDTVLDTGGSADLAFGAKEPSTRTKSAIRLGGDVATMAGIPFVPYASQVAAGAVSRTGRKVSARPMIERPSFRK